MSGDWIEHRRSGDGELLGWMRPEQDGFVVVDLLGRERSGAVDWLPFPMPDTLRPLAR